MEIVDLNLIIILLILIIATDAINGNPCDKYANDKSYFTKTVSYENDTCFFTVKNAIAKTHIETSVTHSGRLFRFNVSGARAVCGGFGAPLPIIHSREEDQFIWEAFGRDEIIKGSRMYRFALGVNTDDMNNLTWDDGSAITLPMDTKVQGGGRPYAHARKVKDEPSRWEILGEYNELAEPAVVICDRNFSTPAVTGYPYGGGSSVQCRVLDVMFVVVWLIGIVYL